MGRRVFSREFKLEAVKLLRDRGVAVMQSSRDLDIAERPHSLNTRWARGCVCRTPPLFQSFRRRTLD